MTVAPRRHDVKQPPSKPYPKHTRRTAPVGHSGFLCLRKRNLTVEAVCDRPWSVERSSDAARPAGHAVARRMRAGGMCLVRSSLSLRLQPKDAPNHGGDAFPVFRFRLELLPSPSGDGIELGLAIVLGRAPLGGDPSLLLQPQQRRIHGAPFSCRTSRLTCSRRRCSMRMSEGNERLQRLLSAPATISSASAFFHRLLRCSSEKP